MIIGASDVIFFVLFCYVFALFYKLSFVIPRTDICKGLESVTPAEPRHRTVTWPLPSKLLPGPPCPSHPVNEQILWLEVTMEHVSTVAES